MGLEVGLGLEVGAPGVEEARVEGRARARAGDPEARVGAGAGAGAGAA